jgi:hypothetical protein
MAQAYNLSYGGCREQEDQSSKLAQEKVHKSSSHQWLSLVPKVILPIGEV